MVVPKEHTESVMEFSPAEYDEGMKLAREVVEKAEKGLGADGTSITVNIKEAGGQMMPHAYIQVFPRFEEDENAGTPTGAIFQHREDLQSKLGELSESMSNVDVSFEKHVAKSEDGEITINIEIENNSSTAIEDLKVKDFIPNIAQVEKTFEFAKPSIRTKNEGTELTWDLDVLEPGDQRVLEYKIRPQIEVEGEVTLPGAELLNEGEQEKKTRDLDTGFHP